MELKGVDTIDLIHEQRLTDVEARAKSNSRRIDDLEKNSEALSSLATSVAVLAEKQNGMAEKQTSMVATVDTIAEKVSNIEQIPAKRWNSIVDKAIWAVVAAMIGYILAHVGL